VVKPLDPRLVRTFGLREVVTSLAEWLDFQAGVWHEITTWYGWASTPFSGGPPALSPGGLSFHLSGLHIPGGGSLPHPPGRGVGDNGAGRGLLRDALIKLGPLPQAASRRAFEYVDGIWWDSTKRVPDNQLVRHRNFIIGPTLYPWKLPDAAHFATLPAAQKEF